MQRLLDRRVLRLGVSALSGLVLALAFPNPGWTWVALPAVAGLTLCARAADTSRRVSATGEAVLQGLVAGLAFFGWVLAWGTVVGPDAWIGLTLLCIASFLVVPVVTAWTARLPAWPLWAASAWVLAEALRGRIPFGGFSWARLAFLTPGTPLAHLATLGGAPLTTFVVALVGALLAAVVERRLPLRRVVLLVGLAVVLCCVGWLVRLPTSGQTDGGAEQVTVALVQGDVQRPGMDFLGRAEQVLTNHVTETVRLAAQIGSGKQPKPAFVIWPENSSDVDPFLDANAASLIDTAAKTVGVPILVGAVIEKPGDAKHELNVGIDWDPVSAPKVVYAKRHLVPFGEYVPFRDVLTRYITRFQRVPKDFAPGSVPGVFTIGGTRVGDVICFEIAYDDIVSDVVRAGGRMIIVQTNNATYGATPQPAQQLQISRFRAIEHGRTTAIAATSGITALIAPDGSVIEQAPTFVPYDIVRPVPLRDSINLADRLRWWPELLLCLGAVATAVIGRWGRRIESRGRRKPTTVGELQGENQ